MRTALDADTANLDTHEQNFVEEIRKHGWFGTHVFANDEGPEFGYTTGFWLQFNFPELIAFSLGRQITHETFWHSYREFETGRRFAIGEPLDEIFENCSAVLLPVSPKQYPDHLGWNRWFYGGDQFECLQLVFPDASGHFPWSHGASESFRAGQPDLTAGNWSGMHIH